MKRILFLLGLVVLNTSLFSQTAQLLSSATQNNCGTATTYTITVFNLPANTQDIPTCTGTKKTHTSTKWYVNGIEKSTSKNNFSFNPSASDISNSGGVFWITADVIITEETLSSPPPQSTSCSVTSTTTNIGVGLQANVTYKSINSNANLSYTGVIKRGCNNVIWVQLNYPGINTAPYTINCLWSLPTGWTVLYQDNFNCKIQVQTSNNPVSSNSISCTFSYGSCNLTKSLTNFVIQDQILSGTINTANGIICPNTSYIFNVDPVECGTASYSWIATGWTIVSLSNGNKTLVAKSPAVLNSTNLNVKCTAAFSNINIPNIYKNFKLYSRTSVQNSPLLTSSNTVNQYKKNIVVNVPVPANSLYGVTIYKTANPTALNPIWESVTSPFLATNNSLIRIFVLPNLDGFDCQGNDVGYCQDFKLVNASSTNPGSFLPLACNVVKPEASTNEFEEEYSFSIYPNPVQSNLHISSSHMENSILNFYEITGKFIFSKSLKDDQSEWIVDLTMLKPGIYIMHHVDSQSKKLSTHRILKVD